MALMVDCSGSMDHPPSKMRHARDATRTAVAALRDGTRFAVIAGTHVAREVYPGGGRLATADDRTREEAGEAVLRLRAGGGTAIGSWLRLTEQLLTSEPAGVRHGILLTDGRNEHETPEELRAALGVCAGRFTCDARGVGTDWEVKEVTGIATSLLGSADIVADPAGLAPDFRTMMESAMGKEVAGCGAAAVDAAGRGGHLRQASGAQRGRSDGPPVRCGSARRGLPDRLLGRRVPRLPRLRTGARRRRGPGDAGRPRLAGRPPAGRRGDAARAGTGAGGVDRRHGRLHLAEPAGRALHGPGGTGPGDPGRAGRAEGRGRRRSDRETGPGGAAGGRLRPRRYGEAAGQGGGRDRRGERYCAAEGTGRGRRRDDLGHPLDEDGPPSPAPSRRLDPGRDGGHCRPCGHGGH